MTNGPNTLGAELRVEMVALARMNPAPYNPRKRLRPGSRGYEALAKGLDEFGLVEPLVWNEATGHIVGGHQRYWIAQDKGVKEIPVSVIFIEELNREKALNVLLNNPRAMGEYDLEALLAIEEQLSLDLFKLSGFEEGEIQLMLLAEDLSSATDFLSTIGDVSAGIGGSGLKEEHAHRTGQQYFESTLVFTAEQREIYMKAIAECKRRTAETNTMAAIVAICEEYLEDEPTL